MRRKRDSEFPENGFEVWGGYMNAKIAKLDEQFTEKVHNEENRASSLFAGISIFVNGYTNPSADHLKCLMSEHGGVYHHYFRSQKTKFIIASNLPDTKIKNLPTTKIVKPEWITDSIKMGSLLDFKDYVLYSNQSKTQPRLHFKIDQKSNNTSETIHNSDIDTLHCTNNPEVSKQRENLDIPSKILPSGSGAVKTAKDSNFLDEFYNNSRLHHISQLGATFKQHINDLRSASDFKFTARKDLKTIAEISGCCANYITQKNSKVIMHIDMDCFFVSVGLRKHPHLKGQPVAVTHSKGSQGTKKDNSNRKLEFDLYKQKRKLGMKKINPNVNMDEEEVFSSRIDPADDEDGKYGSMSEIASCSYEARALGLHNGMFMGPALRLCPNLKTIAYDFEGYKEVAYTLYNTIAQYTLDIEAVSCDEMYVDCTSMLNDIKLSPLEFATLLRQEIRKKTDCPCSTGFGENRLQARLATKKAKPNGQFHLIKNEVETYFANIPLRDMPGIGRQMQYKLKSLGFTTCESLWSANLNYLKQNFGNKTGQLLYQHCRGQDSVPLNFNTVRKSISAGVNYGIRFTDNIQCETFLKQLCQEIHTRMMQNKVIGKSLTLKLMVRAADAPTETAKFMGHGICDNVNKTINLTEPTNNLDVIMKEILEINKKINVNPEDLRGISIQMSKLENPEEIKNIGIKKFMSKKENENKNLVSFDSGNSFDNNKLSEKVNNDKNIINKTNSSCIENKPKLLNLGISKRKGRPPKILPTANKINRTGHDVKKNFFSCDKNVTNSNLNENYSVENVDRDVFDALPDDIKKEILMSYKINNNKIEQETKSNKCLKEILSKESIESNSTTKNNEIPVNLNTNVGDEDFNILNLEWTEVKEMLRMWITSDSLPLLCDIKLVNGYLKNLVMTRKIEDARYLLIFVYSITCKLNQCDWHKVYTEMISSVQESMIITYGKRMSLCNKFTCCNMT